MDLQLLARDPHVKFIRQWSAMEGKVAYVIFEKNGRFFYATTWEIDESPHEIFYNQETGDFVFRNGFRWNSRTRRYEYYQLQENPFLQNPVKGKGGE